MGTIEVLKKKKEAVIKIEGNGTIEHATKIQKSFEETLAAASSSSIKLDIQALKKVDVSFLQILVNMVRACAKKKVAFSLDPADTPQQILDTVTLLGLSHCSEIRRLLQLT